MKLLLVSVKKQLEEVKELNISGNYKKALSLIEKSIKIKGISKEEKHGMFLLKSDIKNRLGEYREVLTLTDKVLKEWTEKDNLLIQVDALIQKGDALTFLFNLKEGLVIAEEIEQRLQVLSHLPRKVLAQREAMLFRFKWFNYFMRGHIKQAQDCIKQYIISAEQSENKQLICFSYLTHTYSLYSFVKDYELAEEYLNKAFEIITAIGNNHLLAVYYFYSGTLSDFKNELKKAGELYKKGLALAKEHGFNKDLPLLYFFSGNNYLKKLELDLALEYCQKSLDYPTGISWRIYPLSNIGYIYYMKGEFNLALEYYLKVLDICREIDEKRLLPELYYNLFMLNIDLGNYHDALEYLELLQKISKNSEFPRVKYTYQFATIISLKESTNMSDWVKAKELLNEFLSKEDLPEFWRIEILYCLLDLRMKELPHTNDQEILTDVKKQIINLQNIAQENNYHFLLVNTYRLLAQLALIELDIKKAFALLITARTLAETKQLTLLVKQIQQEQIKMDEQRGMWQQLQNQDAPISLTLKKASFENTVKKISHETVLEKRDETGKVLEYKKLFVLKL